MEIENLKVINEGGLNDVLVHSPEIDRETSNKITGFASIDKPWLKYYDRLFSEEDIPEMSIYQLALKSNKENMNDIALDLRLSKNHFKKSLAKMSYGEYFNKIDLSSKASKTFNIKTNDIVPILLPNVPEARVLIYSSSIIGAIPFPVSPLMPEAQLENFINENEIKNLFVFEGFYEKYSKSLKRTSLDSIVLLDGSESLPGYIRGIKKLTDIFNSGKKEIYKEDKRIISWDDYISSGKNQEKITPYFSKNHVGAIIGTSGTTGLPKAVCLTDKNINSAALSYKNGKFFEDKNFLDALLPSIGYGISILHFQTVSSKHVYLVPELLTDKYPEALEIIGKEVNQNGGELNFTGGPVHSINLKSSSIFKEKKVPKVQNLVSGGASLSKDVESALNGVSEGYAEDGNINENLLVRGGYGLSEDTAVGTYSKRGSYKFGSIGIPAAYVTVSIFKPDTDEELPYYQHGAICITGPCVMKEYLNNKSETDKVVKVHKDGKRWIHTKDIGYMDEDGNVFHEERIKNIFMRTGFNVHPSKISDFINTFPFVRNSVVIGFDHPKEQCVPVAFVEIDEKKINNASYDDIEALMFEECFQNLEETSVPYKFVFVDMLPINAGGKIDVIKIKEKSGIDFMKEKDNVKKIKFNK